MALANTTWDEYSRRGPISPSRGRRRNSLAPLLAGAILAACALAGLIAAHPQDIAGGFAPAASPAATIAHRTVAAPHRARPQLERNAESFLRDSLPLAGACRTDCASFGSRLAEATKFGRLDRSGIATGLPLAPGFVAAVESAPAAAPDLSVSESAATPLPSAPAPVPVRIAPSVVLPLPPQNLDLAAPEPPMPAQRLDRSSQDGTVFSSLGEPVESPAPPPAARLTPPAPGPIVGRNDGVAIYDISAATVYMPNGERLEAHSGVGYMVDNPRYVDRRNVGPTPPNTYNLVMRKGRFHGVEALRLIPADGNNKYGRVGLLAHTYLLRGRPAESNGCVAFKDYSRFLAAFKRGAVKRLVVVPSLSRSSLRVASTRS